MKYTQIGTLFEDCFEVLTIKEIAQIIRCSESHVLRMIHNDELPCFCIGKQYRVLKSDITACFEKAVIVRWAEDNAT